MSEAHPRVLEIRQKYGFRDGDSLKCHTRSRPKHVEVEQWTSAKSEIIDLALDLDLTMMVNAIHHRIMASKDSQTKAVWALENLTKHFSDSFLADRDSSGAVCIDRMPDNYAFGQIEKMMQAQIDRNGAKVGIPRIVHYSFTSEGASHFNSIVDICLGTLRFCCTAAFDRKERSTQISREVFPKLYRLLHKDPRTNLANGAGLFFLPIVVHADSIRARYDQLSRFLQEHKDAAPSPDLPAQEWTESLPPRRRQ